MTRWSWDSLAAGCVERRVIAAQSLQAISRNSYTVTLDPAPENDVHAPTEGLDFIRTIVEDDLRSGRCKRVLVRFPPEPNGYPHIGHAKSSTLNFGLATQYDGICNLRFDDTNPETEDIEYVRAIKRDLRWMGFDWGDHEFYASDYFEQLYAWAVCLVEKGKAYVDDLSEEEIRSYRGTVTEPGRPSPFRQRTVDENLDLLERMRRGEFGDGERVLRARINMEHPNMKMRDPLMYRIRHARHYRRGDEWCIYPFYDWAHGQSDAIEGITHSICTLEFTVNRPLYDWYLDALEISPRPYQYEFARLNLAYSVTSKRKLLQLVNDGHVTGWDDPRMPTLAGIRRRGVTPMAVRRFCEDVGTTKVDSVSDPELLDHNIRRDLNDKAPRVMCVLRPLKVTITNYPADRQEMIDAPYWPHDIDRQGSRNVPFSRSLLIEREDFRLEPPKGYRRLTPGGAVRLRYAYIIQCDQVVRDADGAVTELLCTYYPDKRSNAQSPKAKGTIHWVDAQCSLPVEVRLYDRLFNAPIPGDGDRAFKEDLNTQALEILQDSRIEPSIEGDGPDTRFQFTRLGYFWQDPEDSRPDRLVFNRIVSLRDTWGKIEAQAAPETGARPLASPTGTVREKSRPPVTRNLSDEVRQWVDQAMNTAGLPEKDAILLATTPGASTYYEEAARSAKPGTVATWLIHSLMPACKGQNLSAITVTPIHFATLVRMVDSGELTTHVAREVLSEMLNSGGDPEELAHKKTSELVEDPAILLPIIDGLLAEFPDKVATYRSGKIGLLGFFVGQVMKATGGKAKPHVVKDLVRDRL